MKCEGQNPTQPCHFNALENHDGQIISRFCRYHGGWRDEKKGQQMALRNYQLGKHAKRVGEFANSSDVKSLREEIGILRLLAEKSLNSLDEDDDTQLLLRTPELSKLISDIRMTVESCDRIETKMGGLLDKTQVAALADNLVAVIANALGESASLSPTEREQIIEKVVTGVAKSIEAVTSGQAPIGFDPA